MKLDNYILDAIILVGAGFIGGLLGSITGLGGSAIMNPIIVATLGLPIRVLIGSGIIATVATSITSTSKYIREGLTNVKIGFTIALTAMLGSVIGVKTNLLIDPRIIFIVFGVVLISAPIVGFIRERRASRTQARVGSGVSTKNIYLASILMVSAGFISGLLGIGAGAFNVLIMEYILLLPLRMATATSTFIIGLTGVTGGILYIKEGLVDPRIIMFTIPGIILGSLTGSRIMVRLRGRTLRYIFTALIWVLGIQMIMKGLY